MATSTTENDGLKHFKTPKSVFIYKRPQWPYEEWSYVLKEDLANVASDDQTSNDDTSRESSLDVIRAPNDIFDAKDNRIIDDKSPCNGEKKIDEDDTSCHEMSSDSESVYAPDHWFDDNLLEDVPDDLPLSRLLAYMEPMLLKYEDGDTKEIANSMNKMMNDIAAKVASSYDVFKGCWVIPVGSVVENTKIEKADEFDFAVVLPVFEQVDGLFDALFEKDEEKMLNDPNLRAFAKDMLNEDGDVTNAVEHFQALMKEVWSFYLEDFAPEGWTVLETFCYGDEISIAGTFHLKRLSDGFTVDVDLCFLAPIHGDVLRRSDFKIEQKQFILENCLDEDNKVYALLLKDHEINFSVNIVRFAMSIKEREFLNRYGEDNGRIRCYKFSKCIAKLFLPKTNKRQDCERCLEALVSSFCLKNIVLYMMHNYPSDAKWTKEQLANRIIEVFQILNFSLKVNCGIVSAYILPYMIKVGAEFTYDPEKRAVLDERMAWLGDVASVPCFLPDLDKVIELFGEDQISRRILGNYRDFLSQSRWSSPEVIDRLVEVLGTLRETCEESRKEIAENPGSTCFQMNTGDISNISAELMNADDA